MRRAGIRAIGLVLSRGPQTIKPAAAVVRAWGGEGCAGKLLGIEAEGGLLR